MIPLMMSREHIKSRYHCRDDMCTHKIRIMIPKIMLCEHIKSRHEYRYDVCEHTILYT